MSTALTRQNPPSTRPRARLESVANVPPRSPRVNRGVVVAVCLALAVGVLIGRSAWGTTEPGTAHEAAYTPHASTFGGRLHMPAVWTGRYVRTAGTNLATLSLHARITGSWSGSGVLEVSLPAGWKADGRQEAATMTGFAAPKGAFGVHAPLLGVLHPGATKLRIIAPVESGKAGQWWLAVDGVETPFHFTAAPHVKSATMDLSGQVRLR